MPSPNILYIMSDDHACNAIGAYGSRLAGIAPTPNLDRIANEGVRADACCCTNAICTPSRATILSGQHSHVNGVRTLDDAYDRSRPHVGHRLQEAGYETAVIGKWHLHTEPAGFDYYQVLPGQGFYFDPRFKEKGKPWQDGDAGGERYEGYVTDLIADFSIDWLRNRGDSDKPFFLMCHHKAPHGLWEFDEKHAGLFDGDRLPEPPSLWEDKSHRSEGSRDFGSTIADLGRDRMSKEGYPTGTLDIEGLDEAGIRRETYQKYLRDYLRTVASIDDNVGRLLDYLDEAGLAEKTVVIYTSDQGQFLGEHDYYDKRWMFEESLRMPFLVRYPAEIPAGSVNRDLLLNLDFAPTFLDYAGAAPSPEMQGRSIRANLRGETPPDWRRSIYYRYWMHMAHHSNPAHYGVRTERYKLIFFYGLPLDAAGALPDPTPPGLELYDLAEDPEELNNVFQDPAYREVAEDLKRELLRLKSQTGDTDRLYPEVQHLWEQAWTSPRPGASAVEASP